MGLSLRVPRVNDMQQQIGILQLLQCGFKRLHQMMGQLGDEADGIRQQYIHGIGHGQLPGRGIQCVKQPVVGRNPRAGQAI